MPPAQHPLLPRVCQSHPEAPLRGLEGVPGLPGAPQDEAGLTRKMDREASRAAIHGVAESWT